MIGRRLAPYAVAVASLLYGGEVRGSIDHKAMFNEDSNLQNLIEERDSQLIERAEARMDGLEEPGPFSSVFSVRQFGRTEGILESFERCYFVRQCGNKCDAYGGSSSLVLGLSMVSSTVGLSSAGSEGYFSSQLGDSSTNGSLLSRYTQREKLGCIALTLFSGAIAVGLLEARRNSRKSFIRA